MSQSKILILVFSAVVVSTTGCGSSSSKPPTSANSVSSADIIGSWNVTRVTCNGNSITSIYIPTGGTLKYTFDGTNLAQIESISSCTQSTTMPYSFNGSNFIIAAGSQYNVICNPSSCTGRGMQPSSACGASGVNSSTSTVTITSLSGGVMTTEESDTQASSICTSYGGVVPFTFSMTKM